MKEENNRTPKNKWSRLLRKKWFFPALYLTLAALLLTTVVWYQSLGNVAKNNEGDKDKTEEHANGPFDQDAKLVNKQEEVIKMPVEDADHAEIVTKFFDYDADDEEQQEALVHHKNRYYQSTGVDIANPDEDDFNVTAALSGTVKDVREDPLYGNIVEMTHKNDVKTYYASLGEAKVESGDKVKQGDVIGTGGQSVLGKDSGVHVHFELRKDDQVINPETYFNQSVTKLDDALSDDKTDDAKKDQDNDSQDSADEHDDQAKDKADDADQDQGKDDDAGHDKAKDDANEKLPNIDDHHDDQNDLNHSSDKNDSKGLDHDNNDATSSSNATTKHA